jgi:hypothetical protein
MSFSNVPLISTILSTSNGSPDLALSAFYLALSGGISANFDPNPKVSTSPRARMLLALSHSHCTALHRQT